ncbi:MAG: SU10 major capsid protein [Bacteroidales bacterium]
MAVLKTFDLNGNKQSFASWISNLSPCDSPFTSMINKEGITQAQYSWQTDALAPADDTTYEEGSQVEFQTRASTQVLTNFTSILRKVVSVSETAEMVATHGRGSETKYQMAKAGKEVMRDLELMNLHNVNGNPGTKNLASKFAGFEGLVGGLGVHDGDTGAIVHKSAMVADKMACIPSDVIFDMTYNLYLAGSKADKIMFHPKHAIAFSGLVNNNPDAEKTYRMFDNLNNTFNIQVKSIRDPLGRVYTLIPNRYMPADKIYFFNESDWTQTILRAPTVSKLGKQGASEQFLLEMEVGLRHRHPFASGVLALETKAVYNNFKPAVGLLTANIGDGAPVTCTTTLDGVAEAGFEVTFHTSNPEVVFFEKSKANTDVAGKVDNILRAGTKAGLANVWTVFRGIRSEVTQITVGDPVIHLVVNDEKPAAGATITLTANVHRAGGSTPVGNDITVKWYVEPASNLELTAITSDTVAGIASTTARVIRAETTVVQATRGGVASNMVLLNYTPKAATIVDFKLTPNTIPVDGFSDLSAKVLDERGMPMSGVAINWVSNDSTIAQPNHISSSTGADGVAHAALRGVSKGSNSVEAMIPGTIITSNQLIYHVGQMASLDFEMTPNPGTFGEETRFHGFIRGEDGLGIPDVQFVIRSDVGIPPMRLDVTTDGDGDYNETFEFTSDSDQTIFVEIPSLGLYKTENLTFKD